MGGLVSSFGLGEGGGDTGASGSKFAAQAPNLTNPVASGDLNTSLSYSKDALQQQQDFLKALQGQNGIQNQSNVYNQLQGISNGTGPNPAQAALNQATSANIANQAALMAGQRGAGSNAGLIARQAAMQGGNLQQQAAGQGATMQAQQALNAINQMGGIAGQQVGNQANASQAYNQAAQGLYGTQLGALGQYNNTLAGVTANQNSVNGQLANTVAGGQQQMAGNIMGGLGGAMGTLGKGSSAPPGGMMAAGAKGGEVMQHYANGSPDGVMPSSYMNNDVSSMMQSPPVPQQGPRSNVGQYHVAQAMGQQPPSVPMFQNSLSQGANQFGQGLGSLASAGYNAAKNYMSSPDSTAMAGEPQESPDKMYAAKGGRVPAMVSPGERYLPPKEVKDVAKGKKNPMEAGEKIPGKAKVKGDSLKNDIVPKTLESGGIVIPRSITEGKDAPQKSAEFVAAVLRKKGKLK